MKKYVWPLILVLAALVGGGAVDYVKIADERGHLLEQLKDAAAVVTTYPPDSIESRAAMERGTMIVAGWPCHWWEDREAARQKAEVVFVNLIAVYRRNTPQANPAKEAGESTAHQ